MKIWLLTAFLASVTALSALPATADAQIITTVAGCGIGDDSLAIKAEVLEPMKVAFDNAGNAYIADQGNRRVRKVDASGVITTYAGTGVYSISGDGGPATAATFQDIFSVAVDRAGNVLVADASGNNIRKINTAGIISTIAGTGIAGYNGDSIAATAAQLNGPCDIAVDTSGNIYIADRFNFLVRKINTAGIIKTVAGNGSPGSPVFGGPATATGLGYPFRIAVDKKGNLFIGSYFDWHIMKADTAGLLTNIAGAGTYGFTGDGGPATAATFTAPCGLTLDTSGNLYFSDIDNDRIREVDMATGIITTIAGSGVDGYGGDGRAADSAEINEPEGISFDVNNNLYIADLDNNRIRRVGQARIMTTYAGQNLLFGEGYPGANAELTNPGNIAVDASGNVYIADVNNNRVRMLNAVTRVITTVAGSGISGYHIGFSGDGGPATAADMNYPTAVAADAAGNLYICDQGNSRIRKVNTAGIISTIAGNGTAGYAGNHTPAITAELNYPTGIAVDAAGNVYVCDNNNQLIRKINTAGIITTIAGNGAAGYSRDGVAATSAELNYPDDVAVDAAGNVYISDQYNSRIRKVDTAGIITTIAGAGSPGYSGDGGPATAAQLFYPLGIKVDNAGDIIIADANNNAVRMVNSEGIISTLAGIGSPGFSGDGGLATDAALNGPSGVAIDLPGNLYIADAVNYRVRKVNVAYLSVAPVKATLPGVLVYPNPTTGTINIINAANSNVVVDDVAGNEVMKASVTSARQTLDISSVASGIYILEITNNNGEKKAVKVTKE